MKQLNVRFEDSVSDQIDSIVDEIGFNKSKVARAALNIGLKELQDSIDKDDKRKASGMVGCNMLRELFIQSER